MSGYTENQIVILRDFEFVFDLTNRIDLWPQLFTEYQAAKILEQQDNYIKFQLTTYPEGDRPSRTWISTRVMNKPEKKATAQRIESMFPFASMQICWNYESILKDQAVVMTWIQEFTLDEGCKFSIEQMESFLNKNTRVQMKSVKKQVEKWQGGI